MHDGAIGVSLLFEGLILGLLVLMILAPVIAFIFAEYVPESWLKILGFCITILTFLLLGVLWLT